MYVSYKIATLHEGSFLLWLAFFSVSFLFCSPGSAICVCDCPLRPPLLLPLPAATASDVPAAPFVVAVPADEWQSLLSLSLERRARAWQRGSGDGGRTLQNSNFEEELPSRQLYLK